MRASYEDLLKILHVTDVQVHSLFRVGSRVYGCDTWASDEDFVAVILKGKQDLVFRPNINITVHNRETFMASVSDHTIFALECIFCPADMRFKSGPPFAFQLDPAKLTARAQATSDKDWNKAVKLFAEELTPSKRKIYHSLRVLLFARQIRQHGSIVDFGEANPIWESIRDNPSPDLDDYLLEFQPLREELLAALH